MKRQLQYVICDNIKTKFPRMNDYEVLDRQFTDWEKAHKVFEMKIKNNQVFPLHTTYFSSVGHTHLKPSRVGEPHL